MFSKCRSIKSQPFVSALRSHKACCKPSMIGHSFSSQQRYVLAKIPITPYHTQYIWCHRFALQSRVLLYSSLIQPSKWTRALWGFYVRPWLIKGHNPVLWVYIFVVTETIKISNIQWTNPVFWSLKGQMCGEICVSACAFIYRRINECAMSSGFPSALKTTEIAPLIVIVYL